MALARLLLDPSNVGKSEMAKAFETPRWWKLLLWITVLLFAILTIWSLLRVIAEPSNGGSWFALICFGVATVGFAVPAITSARRPSAK